MKQPELTLIKENKYLDILIEIDEGSQYTVGTLRVKGDLLKESDELLKLVSMKTGDIFNRSELHKSISYNFV